MFIFCIVNNCKWIVICSCTLNILAQYLFSNLLLVVADLCSFITNIIIAI